MCIYKISTLYKYTIFLHKHYSFYHPCQSHSTSVIWLVRETYLLLQDSRTKTHVLQRGRIKAIGKIFPTTEKYNRICGIHLINNSKMNASSILLLKNTSDEWGNNKKEKREMIINNPRDMRKKYIAMVNGLVISMNKCI